jgi:UDP-2,3-diacylglucosamine pyrophosphatase LpxH
MPEVRSVFISDVHLGTRACQADQLLSFLKEYPSEHLYLVGDIVDFWAMSRGIQWSSAQNTVIQKILRRARQGQQVILIPGNHDEALREYVGIAFGDIRIEQEWVHQTADGKRFLVIHGDEYDQVTYCHRWLALLGDFLYNLLVRVNLSIAWCRRKLHRPGYWSLAGYAKRKVKTAVNFIFDFEDAVAHEAQKRLLDGVICGHIHWATIRNIPSKNLSIPTPITYINCGDWVDSCTGIIEHLDGKFELIQWQATAINQKSS